MNRKEVYYLIEGERDYQDVEWNPESPIMHVHHEPAAWLFLISDRLNRGKYMSMTSKEEMSIIRQIAALAVAAMEQNETPPRLMMLGTKERC